MDKAELDVIHEAVRSSPDVDLPTDRRTLAVLGTFLERNPEFDTSAPPEKYDKLWALQGTDRDVYVPEDDADMERLVGALQRHDDLELLAELLEADDTVALLAALGHGDGGGASGGASTGGASGGATTGGGTTGDGDDGDGGWLSDDDEDDFLDHEDLDRFGERLAWAAGGLVCLTALLTAFLTGFTVYKDVDSWVLTVEFHDTGAIIIVASLVALVVSVGVGFVYRAVADEVYEGYRTDLGAAAFEVPLFAFIAAGLLYLVAPILTNLVALNIVDALLYLVGLVIVLFIGGIPLLLGVFLAVGLVVGVPVYAGVFGGSLLGVPLAALRSDG
jgi:hypothetical protein